MITIITALSFATISLIILGLTMRSERQILQDRMQSQTRSITNTVETDAHLPFNERIFLPFLRRLSGIAMKLTPGGALQALDEKLITAGRPYGLGAIEFMGFRVLSFVGCIALAFLATRSLSLSILLKVVLFGLISFVGLVLPASFLQSRTSTRQTMIRRTLPDTLDLLTVSVEAGLGLDGAMQKVIEKLDNPLAQEMQHALQEMRIGKRRADALKDMAGRAKVHELSTFVAAVCQAEQLGVSISKVLRVQGDTLRTQRSHRAREIAAKLPVKMLFPLIFFIFPALFVVVLAPGAIQIARAMGMIR